MSNIAEELKKKCGGKGQTIAEVVKTMESGSGSGSGSGGGVLIVEEEAYVDENLGEGFLLNKTAGEIKAAYEAGTMVVVHGTESNMDLWRTAFIFYIENMIGFAYHLVVSNTPGENPLEYTAYSLDDKPFRAKLG